MIKNIKEGEDKDMLAVLEMIEEENKMLLAKGERKGIRKGIKEEKRKSARKMLKEGIAIDVISRITELTKEQIEKLKK